VIGAPAVAIVVDGSEIVASQPALVRGGVVVAPLRPYLSGIADRIAVDPAAGTITFERADASVTVTLGDRRARVGAGIVTLPIAPYLRDGGPIIPLAAIARGLGLTVEFDARTHVVTMASPAVAPVSTMTPFVPVPGASPFPTPRAEPSATPRPVVIGVPRPRRTPVEVNDPPRS
jgi:copper amine oxidase-like protein